MPWRPAFDTHAITLARAIFVFDQLLPQKMLRSAQSSVQTRQKELGFDTIRPVQDGVQTIELRISQDGGPAINPSQTDTNQGVIFQKTAPVDGGASLRRIEEVGLRPNAFGYVADFYDRWGGFENRLFETLAEPLEKSLLVVGVGSITLEYQNVFVYDGDPNKYKALELFDVKFAHMKSTAVDPYRHWDVQISWETEESFLPDWQVLYPVSYTHLRAHET